VDYGRGDVVFSQGDICENVLYIQKGGVKLSVLSKTGREAVVAMLGPGDFFGEGCLAGQPVRMGSATAVTPSTILVIQKDRMVRLLHKQHALSDRFISYMLARNIRIEEDLIDQLFNSSEKRLASRSCDSPVTGSWTRRGACCRRSRPTRWRRRSGRLERA
jgi:CRP-like cAMP-binding protein